MKVLRAPSTAEPFMLLSFLTCPQIYIPCHGHPDPLSASHSYLEKVSNMCIGPFGVGPRNFEQGALLANHKDIHQFPNIVTLSCPNDKEISFWHLMKINWSTKKIVLKCLAKVKTQNLHTEKP